MQRTSADLAKFVGLALFTLSKPEFTPFLCSFFPQVRCVCALVSFCVECRHAGLANTHPPLPLPAIRRRQVVPSTYLTSDGKLQRAQQKNFQRVRVRCRPTWLQQVWRWSTKN